MRSDALISDLCLQWRILDYQKKYLHNPIGDDWNCSMHPNSAYQSCSKPEATERIAEGKLQKTAEEDDEARQKRAAALAKQKEKAEKELQELQSRTVVRSARDAHRISAQQREKEAVRSASVKAVGYSLSSCHSIYDKMVI